MTKPLWQPSENAMHASHMHGFIQAVNKQYHLKITDYPALYQWSIEYPENFWKLLTEFCQVKFSSKEDSVLHTGDRMIDARWFTGATLNFAEHLLRHNGDGLALIAIDEKNRRIAYTHAELYVAVAQCAQGLKNLGVGPNDVVAGLLPNVPHTIIAMLATTSLGAIWTACSPDFGEAGVLDRFSQVSPKVLIAVDGYYFKGKKINCLPEVRALQKQLPQLKQTILVNFLEDEIELMPDAHEIIWRDFINNDARTLSFAQLPFNHPLYILYSSGTTGAPKCIVHGAGGTLLQHLKELVLHTDLKAADTLFYYTTCGWMMWHWMVSGLATGATLLLYEGAPLYPESQRLWDVIEEEKVSVFGTSARYLNAINKAGLIPKTHYDLSRLRMILSTGSPLLVEDYDYVYAAIKTEVCLASISGGTDIISCFALGCPLLPVYPGELQAIGLGMRVAIYNDQGQAVQEAKGELVCTAPFPSMPIYFWQDEKNARYLHSYFDRFPNVWAHGDFAQMTAHGGLIIYGRSDATLKPGGVRIGTAEIYRPVEKIAEVLECLAIGQPWQGDIRIILFVVLRPGWVLDEVLRHKIGEAIRKEASPRHVPAEIIQVNDLPRTLNGKLSELAVKQVVMGQAVDNIHALANPECLTQFENLTTLKSALELGRHP